VLAQRYELKEELGRGAHGRIYSGRDKITKQVIAVKVVSYLDAKLTFKYRWKSYRRIRASLSGRSHS